MTKEQTLPKWFNGTVYEDGETVANRFTGEEIELNNIELSMYDFVMGVTMVIEMGKYNDKLLSMHRKGLQWFRVHNPTAYMVLLD
tara:strand:+ start:233 stop:487 length:255 start_codon:yes stop_codon:yes gene_type:complete